MHRAKHYSLAFVLLASVAATEVRSQDEYGDAELDELLAILNQQTTLATRTRLNADFVPGMVSVLTSEQLQRRGLRDLWQALDTIPGVRTYRDASGARAISVRGIGDLFEPGKVKLLLNGVAVNASASATSGTIFDTPAAQIERIELIRGPGSALHGEFAYAGVLNVVTHVGADHYAGGADSVGGAGAAVAFDLARGSPAIDASLNLAVTRSDGEDIDSGRDRSVGIPSYAPGSINNPREFISAILDLETDDLRALIQFQQGRRGDYFGSDDLLPPDDSEFVITDRMFSATIARNFRLGSDIDAEWSLGAIQLTTDKDDLFRGRPEAFGGTASDDDVYADSLLEERRFEAMLSLQTVRGAHSLYGELSAADIEVTESEQFINLDPLTRLPSPTVNEFDAPVDEGTKRRMTSLVVQDEYRINDRTTLTSGLRFDDYQRVGKQLSPRIALVWRESERHVYKAQLARAFRPPSLIEEQGAIGKGIDPESNDTIEFGHVYRRADLALRNTVYYTRLEDLIWFQDSPPYGYRNIDSQKLVGYEVELTRDLGVDWQIDASLSLQDYADEGPAGMAPWMLKIGVGRALAPLTDVHLQLNVISERERADGDSRDDFERTNRLDLALRRRNLGGIGGLDLKVGIDNLLDERLEHPAPADTYPADYPYSDGASFWLQLVYRP